MVDRVKTSLEVKLKSLYSWDNSVFLCPTTYLLYPSGLDVFEKKSRVGYNQYKKKMEKAQQWGSQYGR